ncbi:ABC transporter permease [Inquilinus sp. CA228]|uniref:ABC transporter permease n=1 Tax=Inquilinus sp. CA228 TaxID=3455609 RepID=UPI003F8CFF0C
MEALRPYTAAFASRFLLMMQYRAAALAGFATQCWFGAVRVMVLAAFYLGAPEAASPASLSLSQAVTYTWLAQGLLALLPWMADPDIAASVRTGAIGYDRLRPVDAYALWYARTAGWMTARVVPRVALMILAAGIVLPLIGQAEWAWQPPPSASAALLFILSLTLAAALSCAVVMLINIVVVATLNARGVNALAVPVVIVFSGSLLPLPLYPDAIAAMLFVQPLAGVLDIPNRIYAGALTGVTAWAGLGLQAFWTLALILAGRLWLGRVMRRLEVQGG